MAQNPENSESQNIDAAIERANSRQADSYIMLLQRVAKCG
jgi:hypothetical protein